MMGRRLPGGWLDFRPIVVVGNFISVALLLNINYRLVVHDLLLASYRFAELCFKHASYN